MNQNISRLGHQAQWPLTVWFHVEISHQTFWPSDFEFSTRRKARADWHIERINVCDDVDDKVKKGHPWLQSSQVKSSRLAIAFMMQLHG